MSHSPEQNRKKAEARSAAMEHMDKNVQGEPTADQLNAKIAARFKEYNEPDKSIFGVVGRDLRQEERKLALRDKYAKEDEGK